MQINRIDGLSCVVCSGNCWNACPLQALPEAAGGQGLFSMGGWLQPAPLFALGSWNNLPPESFPRLCTGCMYNGHVLKQSGTFLSFVSRMQQQAFSATCSVSEEHNPGVHFPAFLTQPSLKPFALNKGLDQSKTGWDAQRHAKDKELNTSGTHILSHQRISKPFPEGH